MCSGESQKAMEGDLAIAKGEFVQFTCLPSLLTDPLPHGHRGGLLEAMYVHTAPLLQLIGPS